MMPRTPLRRRLSFAAALAPAALLLAGCGGQAPAGGGKAGKGTKGGAAPVLVAAAERKVVPLALEAIGAVEPIRTTAVRSQVTGTLLKRVIREGQDVKQGDLLFEIDPRPFRNALQAAEAELQKVRVQLETARAQVARYRGLTADQMVSKEQFEKINDTARALEAESLSVESRLATARIQLEYCSIRAPLAGRAGQITLHEGDIVRGNDTGAPLTTIHQLSPINVTFGVPQQYLGALQRYRAAGQLAVAATPPGADEKSETGELTFLDNAVESATGTLRLKAAFPNPAQRLWPGQFVTVALTLANPEVIAIPASALQTSQAGQYVYVVKADRTAELRPVTVERTVGAAAVVAQGLAPGETVVTEGQLRVVPGRAVDVREPTGGTRPAAKGGKGARAAQDGKETPKP
ncbi:MAG: efflux RND transporter periplasmic adaptor subunit [Opitutaceae bacterium]